MVLGLMVLGKIRFDAAGLGVTAGFEIMAELPTYGA